MKTIRKSLFVIFGILPLFMFFTIFAIAATNSSSSSNIQNGTGSVTVEDGEFGSPLPSGFSITSEAGARRLDGYHYGMDLVHSYGAEVYAISDALVYETYTQCSPDGGHLGNRCTESGSVWWGGNYVVLKFDYQDQTYYTIYAHLKDVAVQTGDTVEKGQVIGHQGNSGNSTGSHLHLEIHTGGVHSGMDDSLVNPRDLIRFQDNESE